MTYFVVHGCSLNGFETFFPVNIQYLLFIFMYFFSVKAQRKFLQKICMLLNYPTVLGSGLAGIGGLTSSLLSFDQNRNHPLLSFELGGLSRDRETEILFKKYLSQKFREF